MSADALPDQSALHGPWTIAVDLTPAKINGDYLLGPRQKGRRTWYENHPKSWALVEVVSKEALARAIVGGVEVAGKVRDANQAERRRLEAENEALGRALTEAVRLRDQAQHFYEAAMNWFPADEWREFEAADEFVAVDAEYRSGPSDEQERSA